MSKYYSSSKKRGTTGGNTYAIVNGQTIEREKAVQVKNPRTGLQMAQRVKWANLVFFWTLSGQAMLKGFIDKKKNQSWFNAFMSLNLGVPGTYLTKEEAAAKTCIAAPYYVARGPLARVGIDWDDSPTLKTTLLLGRSALTTMGQLSSAIIANNNGWMNGDKLCVLYSYWSGDDQDVIAGFIKKEFVLDVASSAPVESWLIVPIVSTTTDAYLCISQSVLDVTEAGNSIAVVHTRKRANKISTSTQQMVIYDGAGDDHRTEVYKQTAISSYDADAPVFYDPDAE